jgi:hypothetical protein
VSLEDGGEGTMISLKVGVAVAGFVVFAAAPLVADTLVLRDGRRIRGELRSVRDGVIEFVEQGFLSTRTLRVSRDEVERIEFDEAPGSRAAERGTPARPAGLREREVSVAADAAWTDTGIDVRPGQMLYFEATGRITWGPDRRDGPGGERGSPRNPHRPMPNRPAAALIGKIGAESTDYFFIGADPGPLRAPARGRLFLGINDDYLADNRGAFRVTVFY